MTSAGRDLNQLVRSRFPDEDGHFVVGRAAAGLLRERLDGLIPLLAALTVPAEQVLRDASNLKPHVTPPRIVPVVNVVPEPAHPVGERIPVDLGQVRALGIDVRRLQRLPPSLGPVVRQVAGHRMRVELRIELATGVVVVDGEDQVTRDAILVGAVLPHTRRRRGLQFLQGRLDRVVMCLHEPVIVSDRGHDRDRLGGREGEVVQMPSPALDLAVHRRAVRALPRPQPFSGRGMEALPNGLELRLRDLAHETEFGGAAALPVADHSLTFGVVVAVHQMMRRVPRPFDIARIVNMRGHHA